MWKALLLIVCLLPAVSSLAQVTNVEVFLTSEQKGRGELPYTATPLNWSDFRGKPDRKSGHAAMTYIGIRISYQAVRQSGNVTYKVFLSPYMDQSLSWYKPGLASRGLLEHEQRHFDLTALVARELAETIRNTDFRLVSFPKELNRLHSRHLEKLELVQKEYDHDTLHGLMPARQEEWNKYLAATLHRLAWLDVRSH